MEARMEAMERGKAQHSYRRTRRKRYHSGVRPTARSRAQRSRTPVTPEVAGSSPVAPVHRHAVTSVATSCSRAGSLWRHRQPA
jgi:hypothetical protein